jgi:hypothetical protein
MAQNQRRPDDAISDAAFAVQMQIRTTDSHGSWGNHNFVGEWIAAATWLESYDTGPL